MLEKYVPRLLVTHLIGETVTDEASCTHLDGVVLFVDIVDSTALTDEFARLCGDGAERLASVLDEYFGRVIDLALLHGGDLLKIDGDAVLILWYRGCAPGATSQPIAAARAALELRDAFAAAPATIRHRISLVAGKIDFIVFREGSGRGHYVVDGAPLRQLGDPGMRGLPGQIVASGEVHALLGENATLVPAACGASELLALSSAYAGGQPATTLAASTDLESRVRLFVPKVIVDRLAAGMSAWTAEFRQITAIFVNLRALDPGGQHVAVRISSAVRTIAAIVNPRGVPITNIIANEKGFVIQIACGLPPFAQEHSAVLAVESALHIGRDLAVMGMPVAIGISTGQAFCGEVGSATRREYLSTGLVMAYAARLMQAAANEIVCDEATARAAMDHAEFSEPRLLMFRGRRDPLVVRSVKGLLRSRARSPAYIGPIFGRDAELHEIRQCLALLMQGTGGIVGIEAEAGAGKTHFIAHAAESARHLGFLTATAVASQIEESTAYFALRTLLPHLVREESDPPELAVDALRERILALVHDAHLVPRLALLEDIMPLEFADRGLAPEIKGQARQSGIVDLMVHIARERTARAPAVLFVDDVQWLDASSAHVLNALTQQAPRTLVVVTSRPVDSSTPAHVRSLLAAAAPHIALPRLPSRSIEALVKERLGSVQVPASLVEFIHERSEGLPFYAEQLLYSLRDHGLLEIAHGACTVSLAELPELAAPDSLRELIVSRIDRLPPARQLAIKVASAVGRVFDADTVHEVHPLKEGLASLEDSLERLTESGFLSRTNEQGRPEFAFCHGIIQGVTYDLLPYAQRRPLHKSIALHLENKYGGALAPHYATLALHWERAAEADRAIAFRISAADIAAQRYANHDALKHIDYVDRLVAQFGVRLARSDLAHCTRIRADACQELTRFQEAHGEYRKLAGLEGIAVPGTRIAMIAALGRQSAIQALHRAGVIRTRASGEARARDGLAAHIYMRFAEHAYFTNNTLGLAHGTLASLNYAERADALPEIVNASGGLALGLAALGFLRWASYYRERSIELSNRAGSPSAQGFAELLACVQSFHTGEWNRMSLHGARGAHIWKELGDRYRHQACLVLEAYRMIATGSYERADHALSAFGNEGEEIESAQVRAWALAARALVDLVLGRQPAVAIARLTTAFATGNLNPAESLLCNGIAAAAYLEAGDRAAALRAAEAGLANIKQGSPAMAGALLFSVPSIAEALLLLAQDPAAAGRSRDELVALCKTACRAAQRFAARNRICRPRASLLRGHLAGARGRVRRQQSCYKEALADAKRLGLPLEQAMSHYALAEVTGRAAERDAHRHEAGEILARLGVAWSPWQRLRY